ncbi:MAG: NnrU family protein [Paracoccaceae bacterium]
MPLLVLGLALWVLAHGLKIHAPAARARLAARLGEGTVKIGATAALALSLALMVIGYQSADYVALWTPPGWTVHLNNLLMVFAIGIYGAAAFNSYPRHVIRHPQLIGVKVWAVAHLAANGHLAAVILFGGLLAWAVVAVIAINKRDGKGPLPGPGSLKGNAIHLVLTLVGVAAIGWVHNWLGVWPFAGDPPV